MYKCILILTNQTPNLEFKFLKLNEFFISNALLSSQHDIVQIVLHF